MSMSLRDRTKGGTATPPNELAAPSKAAATTKRVAKPKSKPKEKEKPGAAARGETKAVESSADEQSSTEAPKKLPRVILKLGPKPTDGQLPTSVSEQSS